MLFLIFILLNEDQQVTHRICGPAADFEISRMKGENIYSIAVLRSDILYENVLEFNFVTAHEAQAWMQQEF